jgi:FG-GAP-like repeat
MTMLSNRWSVRLGGSYQEVEPVPDGSGDLLMADAGGIQRVSSEGTVRWRTKPFGAHWIAGVFDLDDDGHLEILTSNGREVIILSAETGEFLFRDTVGPPFSYGTYAPMFQVHSFFGKGVQILVPCFSNKEVLIYDCSNGVRNARILHRLWMDDSYHPSIVIGDVNNDGVDEIVIARLGGVYVFEPHSGKMISQTIWKSDEERRRNYGHFELADINGDGNLEAIILSDKVTRHLAVLANDGNGNFQPLWDRLIEHIYPNDTTELRYTTNSIRDFNGDGKLEIAVSIFNERKDERWHTEILRAETGERLLDLPDQYLRGVQDVNWDGKPEFCLSHEPLRGLKSHSEISIYSPREGKTIWRLQDGRFAERAVHPNCKYSEFKPDVFAAHEIWRGNVGIYIQSAELGLCVLRDNVVLEPLGYKSHDSYRVVLAETDHILVSEANGNLIKITKEGPQHFLSCGYHLTTEAHISARPGSIARVAIGNGARYLAVPDFSGNIHIFKSDHKGFPAQIAKIRGRSRLGYDGIFHIASIIETHDGLRLVVIDDEGLTHAQLSLYSLEGECLHSYKFPDMPPSVVGNRIGCYDWLYFQHPRGEALFASFYQSPSMNSECSLAFLMETGEVLWRKDRVGVGDYGRGVGPWGTSALHNNTAVFCAKDTLCHLDLETGEFICEPKVLTEYTAAAMRSANDLPEQTLSTSSSIEDPFTAYGTPIINGDDEIIGGCFGGFGVLDKSGMPKWWHRAAFGDVMYRLPGIGDIDSDGKLEFGQGHADGTFRIYDYETGALRASINLNAISTDVLTHDSKFIIGTNDGRLIIISYEDKEFVIFNEIETGSAMGSPIAAGFDGDGVAEIYVVTGDGNLLCFV